MPPSLSYKGRAERDAEELEERQRQERERLEQVRAEAHARETELKGDVRRSGEPSAGAPQRPPAPSLQRTPDEALFEEDALSLTSKEVASIELLGTPDTEEEGEAEAGPEEAEGEARPTKRPPRPPKSPDKRPVVAGFILVFTGLAQLLWGAWSMTQTGEVGTGSWAPFFRWGHFSFAFIAVLLGLLAVRGGLWSFRKERFDVVKVGAIASTVCVWALWVPWLFGLLALLIVHRARKEYYPFYDPRWDAPSGIAPPPSAVVEEEAGDTDKEDRSGPTEGDGLEEDDLDWEPPASREDGDALSV